MKDVSIQNLMDLYDLEPHPEGGYFKETFRDVGVISKSALPKKFAGDCNYSTAIYFLIPEGKKSHLHRLHSDEVWHFYLGGPLTLIQISPEGKVNKIILGQDIKNQQKLQYVVPAGFWFGAYPNQNSGYSFVGCTQSPGFDFSDFEMGDRAKLLKLYPQAKEEIILLTD